MRVTRLGQLILGLGFAGVGVLSLVTADFTLLWMLYPAWEPWREAIADASGALLLIGGLGMLLPRTARAATLVITVNVLLWLVVFGLPGVVTQPGNELMWLKFGQNLMLVTAGWTLLAGSDAGARNLRPARVVYGLALPMVGLSHFVYIKAAVSFVPARLPFHAGFACLTGAAHIAAGLAILFGILPRLAATAEAAMITLFLLMVSVPDIVAGPVTRLLWVRLLITATCAGAAWVIAGSLKGAAWGLARPKTPRAEGSTRMA